MRRGLFCLAILMIVAPVCLGQARRIVLLEEATNASCGPCAANNPGLQDFVSAHFGGVISVRYHAWWPGTDPMYTASETDNSARISYYDISGVPNYTLDGVNHGVPSDPAMMAARMAGRLSQSSPVKIVIKANIDADRVETEVSLICLDPVSQSNLYLRGAVIERMVVYDQPPGSNGETVFADVMRDMIRGARGFSVPALHPGDTLAYHMNCSVDPAWNWQDLAFVSWLQSDQTREVIQSNINLPTYVIESAQPPADILEINTSYTKDYFIHNENADTLHMRIRIGEAQIPPQWTCALIYRSQSLDSFDVDVAPGDTLAFGLSLSTGSVAGWGRLRIFAKNLDDPHGYGFSRGYYGLIPQGDVLLVDDDGGEKYESLFQAALDRAGAAYTSLTESELLLLGGQLDIRQFRVMFWNASWAFPAFVPDDIAMLKEYLDGRGNLFLAGQDIGWDISSPTGNSFFPEAQDFYARYLDAAYLGDEAGTNQVTGISGDPIGDGLSFSLSSVYDLYPDYVKSNTGLSVPIFQYTGTNRYGGIRYDSGTYRIIYTCFGLEQIANIQSAYLLVDRALAWLRTGTGIVLNPEGPPSSFWLGQNYPNPFNPTTAIGYQLSAHSSPIHTTLKVYNLLGQEVATLVDKVQEPGTYNVTWDASDMASGVYFCTLTAGTFVQTKRMVLMK